ncbi:MAG: 4Fe-4S cluster-binding domain-containing protein [Eggerthellaceae bacterium]|nr:4Fe-4S cluster-binding domain-containing protein [Eggerthellaceae bacterium]
MVPSRSPYTEGFAERWAKMAMKPKLDVQVCDHCNLRCAGCLHFAPLAGERFLDLEEYERDLEQLAAVDRVAGYFDAIVLMGGEPLLHPRIVDVMRSTRHFLPGEYVSLCTNGLLLRRMDDAFWDTLTECAIELAISPYPIHMDYVELAEYARSKGAKTFFTGDITGAGAGKETFMRLALDPHGERDPARSFTSCPFGGCYLQLARGSIWLCQVAAHHGSLARRFRFHMHDSPDDALPLGSIVSTDDIEAFRRRPHPMCRHCNNEALTVAPWEQSKLEAGEWLA